ncbi:MAG: hypothetical protein WD069_02220 [Planctomycetales bacterium]
MDKVRLRERSDEVSEVAWQRDSKARKLLCGGSPDDLEAISRAIDVGVATNSSFVERHAEREKVGAGVNFRLVVPALLGGSVADGAASSRCRSCGQGVKIEVPGKAEVDEPELAIWVNDDVGGLHVAVDDIYGFGGDQRLGHVQCKSQKFVVRERSCLDSIAEVSSKNPLFTKPYDRPSIAGELPMLEDVRHSRRLNL